MTDNVEKSFGCPVCGESNVDKLEINESEDGEECVECLNCGHIYQL